MALSQTLSYADMISGRNSRMGFAQTAALAGPPALPSTIRSGFIQRLVTPTLLDLFFLSVVALSFLTSGTGWGRLLWDGDTALHTGIGNWILDHHQIPVTDPFSYTMPGAPWLAVEWGTGVLFAVLNGAFGLKGIVFVCGVVIATTVMLVVRSALAAGTDTFVALGLGLMANNALMLHYHARPHVFALLLFALVVWIVGCDRLRPSRWIWTLPLLTVLWANLHPGFVLLILYLGLVAGGYAIEWVSSRNSSAGSLVLRYGGLAVVCGVSALANPFGYKLYAEIASYLQAKGMTDLIQEFQAPTFRTAPQLYYLCFLFAGLGLVSALLQRKDYSSTLVIVAMAYASLTSVRHSTVYVVAAAPVIGRELTRVLDSIVARASKNSILGILGDLSRERRSALNSMSVLPAAALIALFVFSPAAAWPKGFDPTLFPVNLASKHAAALSTSRVFTAEQWADYLLFTNYPRQRVFFDDRALYGERLFRQVADLMMARPGSLLPLERYRVDYALLAPDLPLCTVLALTPGWREIDRDKTAVLFRHSR